MREAQSFRYHYSLTMMFGHVETIEERFENLVWIKKSQKPQLELKGFNAFIPWPYMDDGTLLQRVKEENSVSDDEYIRTLQ